MKKQLLLPILVLAFGAISGFAQADSMAQPNAVPFAKVMNPSFAEDYQQVQVKVAAQFLAPNPAENWVWTAIPQGKIKDKVAFQAIAPGTMPPAGLSNIAPHVFIDKAKSDILFELKPGDLITIVGHTLVGKDSSIFTSVTQVEVVFIADSVEKAKPASSN